MKGNTEEVSDVSENGEVAKVGVSLTPSAMMRRAEPRAHDPFIVCFAYKFKFNFKLSFSFKFVFKLKCVMIGTGDLSVLTVTLVKQDRKHPVTCKNIKRLYVT